MIRNRDQYLRRELYLARMIHGERVTGGERRGVSPLAGDATIFVDAGTSPSLQNGYYSLPLCGSVVSSGGSLTYSYIWIDKLHQDRLPR